MRTFTYRSTFLYAVQCTGQQILSVSQSEVGIGENMQMMGPKKNKEYFSEDFQYKIVIS
jgi:hypothetical protein